MVFDESVRAEMLREFRTAKEPAKQIKIMADLHQCSVQDIKTALAKEGVAAEEMVLRNRKNTSTAPAPTGSAPRSGLRSALAALREELGKIEARESEIPQLIAALQSELEGIIAKKTAVNRAIDILSEVADK